MTCLGNLLQVNSWQKKKIPDRHTSPKRLGGFLFRAGTRGGFRF
jgi:hypothetical protein